MIFIVDKNMKNDLENFKNYRNTVQLKRVIWVLSVFPIY